MRYEIQPVSVDREYLLALHLHEQYLSQEYERIVASGTNAVASHHEALKEIGKRIKDCEKARSYLERNYVNCEEIEDETEY